MKSAERTTIDNILVNNLGTGYRVTSDQFVFNDKHKTFRRFKYVRLYATPDQLAAINRDLTAAFPNNKVTAYLTQEDARSNSLWYDGLAVRLYH